MPFINEQLDHNKAVIEKQATKTETITKKCTRASRFRFDPASVMQHLRARIVGQDEALAAVEDALYTIKADFGSADKPLSVMLFIGPTGVGKTEIARVLCQAVVGDARNLCRIDMNTLAQEHYSAALTGSPPGYVGSKEGQSLFDPEAIKGSYSIPGVVLFDEIEKADKHVVRAILNILDTGKLTLTSGAKEIDFSNALIFMTSNIGVKELTARADKYRRGWRKWFDLKPSAINTMLENALHHHFDLEFINRIDRIIPFNDLDNQHLNRLVDIEFELLNKRLSRQQIYFEVSDSVKEFLSQCYDERFGARAIKRVIRTKLEPKLARAIFDFSLCKRFYVDMENGELQVSCRD